MPGVRNKWAFFTVASFSGDPHKDLINKLIFKIILFFTVRTTLSFCLLCFFSHLLHQSCLTGKGKFMNFWICFMFHYFRQCVFKCYREQYATRIEATQQQQQQVISLIHGANSVVHMSERIMLPQILQLLEEKCRNILKKRLLVTESEFVLLTR